MVRVMSAAGHAIATLGGTALAYQSISTDRLADVKNGEFKGLWQCQVVDTRGLKIPA